MLSTPYNLGSTFQTEMQKLNIKLEDIDCNPDLIEMELETEKEA